jgi:hypothetical protein
MIKLYLLIRIIRRIATLLSQQGSLIAQSEASMRQVIIISKVELVKIVNLIKHLIQAASASDAARRLMDDNSDKKKGSGDGQSKDRIDILQTKVTTLMEGETIL